jgi:hypothetical protein
MKKYPVSTRVNRPENDDQEGKVRNAFGEQFGLYFGQRMLRVYGSVAAIVSLCLALYKLLIQSVPSRIQGYVLVGVGLLLWAGTALLTRLPHKQ